MSENIYTQDDMESILESHRKDLQRTIIQRQIEIAGLRTEIDRLSTRLPGIARVFGQVEVDQIMAKCRRDLRDVNSQQATTITALQTEIFALKGATNDRA